MKVSIITVCLNSEDTIEQTINSVLSQSYPHIEYIVIDGGSVDRTINIISQYKDKTSKYISEKDEGIYNAMNKGLALCEGDVIGFMNADDFYADRSVISEVVAFMQENDFEAIYGDLVYVDRLDEDRVVRYWRAGEYKKGAFYNNWVPPHPTFFCRRQVFEKYGYFNDKLQIAADFELMLRFIEKHQIKVGYLPKVIVKMRTGGKANILLGIIRGNLEIIRSFRMNNLRFPPFLFVIKPIMKIAQLFRRPSDLNN